MCKCTVLLQTGTYLAVLQNLLPVWPACQLVPLFHPAYRGPCLKGIFTAMCCFVLLFRIIFVVRDSKSGGRMLANITLGHAPVVLTWLPWTGLT